MTGMMGFGATAFPFGTASDPQQQGASAGSTQGAGDGSGSGTDQQQTNLLQGIMQDPSGKVGGGGGIWKEVAEGGIRKVG